MDEKLTNKALEIVDQLTAGLKAVAPQMADLTLQAVHFQGVMNIACGFIYLLLECVAMFISLKFLQWAFKQNEEDHFGKIMVAVFGSISMAIINCILVGNAFYNLLSVYNWAAVVDPRLAIALQVIHKVM